VVPVSESLKQKIKLLIFDADGTLRMTTVSGQPSPKNAGEWRLLPKVKETLSQMAWGRNGFLLGIASNQDGIGLGDLTPNRARELLVQMVIQAVGYFPPDTIIEFCCCPDGVECRRKKPRPGMLIDIMSRLGIAPEQTLFVGDQEWDQEAARRAGVHFMWARDFFRWNFAPLR
jgi:D-glycero-D-manno-heptose 1,7-bisphosphate phosphatase